jgi:hypothetical protein
MPSCVYKGHVPEEALLMSMPLPRRNSALTRETFPLLMRIKSVTTATPMRTSLSIVPTFSMKNLHNDLTIFSDERATVQVVRFRDGRIMLFIFGAVVSQRQNNKTLTRERRRGAFSLP